MRRSDTIPTMRIVILLVAGMLPAFALGCARQQLFKSAPNVEQVMKTMVDPAAKLIWGSVSISVTADGVEEKFPRTDQAWSELRNAAAALTESGNSLKADNRAAANSEWMRWSQSLVEAAAETLTAIDAKNPDGILAAGEHIYNTCVGCHGRYSMMTPPP